MTANVVNPRQLALPVARVHGKPITSVPEDLYIPPNALAVLLDTFEGPLDLLLYLIRHQNLDICEIPIAKITEQYMGYVKLMHEFQLELAADYLVMAALLAEIKSRLLLPRREMLSLEEDPRAELVRRLQEYEQVRQAALDLDNLPRFEREHWAAQTAAEFEPPVRAQPEVKLPELLAAFQQLLKRADLLTHHQIKREPLSMRERMSRVLAQLQGQSALSFASFFAPEEGRRGVVVSLMAILELLKAQLIEVHQADEAYAPLMISLPTSPQAVAA
ncbi:segregation and condensation protein A [Thiolinea disciformis]|uniref:segregation and condensation protein A n=1 Tax=Thiolinea disciformis TaxID=125614 RepID=UPI00037515CF|nr:ScpA family protein [Thiolinea disciformis]